MNDEPVPTEGQRSDKWQYPTPRTEELLDMLHFTNALPSVRAIKLMQLAMQLERDLAEERLGRHQLQQALVRASLWGMRSEGFSAEVSDALRIWVDGGMQGDPPALPSYYPARPLAAPGAAE
jgi:hypothetical protein